MNTDSQPAVNGWMLAIGVAIVVGIAIFASMWKPGTERVGELPVAGELVGDRLTARDGTAIGVVTDAVMNVESGQVDYVVVRLTSGGRRTIMETPEHPYLVVPWSIVGSQQRSGELRVDAETAMLLAAPRSEAPPDPHVVGWDGAVKDYWGIGAPELGTR